MLFVSPHAGYLLTGIKQPRDVYHPASGEVIDTVAGIDAEFIHGGAPEWAVNVALEDPTFQQLWTGLPDGVDRRLFVGTFDTDKKALENNWDEETKEHVEQFLLNNPDHGFRYKLIVPPSQIADLPWPNYDDTHHFQIVKVAKEIGADLAYCLEYERKHKNRPAVITALEAEVGEKEELVAA